MGQLVGVEKTEIAAPRSPCPVANALDLIGDRWTLLVIRDIAMGGSRFKDFASSPERIPTNILTDRLNRLLAAGILEQVPVSPSSKRFAYQLSEKGKELLPILRLVRDWGLKHISGTAVPPEFAAKMSQ